MVPFEHKLVAEVEICSKVEATNLQVDCFRLDTLLLISQDEIFPILRRPYMDACVRRQKIIQNEASLVEIYLNSFTSQDPFVALKNLVKLENHINMFSKHMRDTFSFDDLLANFYKLLACQFDAVRINGEATFNTTSNIIDPSKLGASFRFLEQAELIKTFLPVQHQIIKLITLAQQGCLDAVNIFFSYVIGKGKRDFDETKEAALPFLEKSLHEMELLRTVFSAIKELTDFDYTCFLLELVQFPGVLIDSATKIWQTGSSFDVNHVFQHIVGIRSCGWILKYMSKAQVDSFGSFEQLIVTDCHILQHKIRVAISELLLDTPENLDLTGNIKKMQLLRMLGEKLDPKKRHEIFVTADRTLNDLISHHIQNGIFSQIRINFIDPLINEMKIQAEFFQKLSATLSVSSSVESNVVLGGVQTLSKDRSAVVLVPASKSNEGRLYIKYAQLQASFAEKILCYLEWSLQIDCLKAYSSQLLIEVQDCLRKFSALVQKEMADALDFIQNGHDGLLTCEDYAIALAGRFEQLQFYKVSNLTHVMSYFDCQDWVASLETVYFAICGDDTATLGTQINAAQALIRIDQFRSPDEYMFADLLAVLKSKFDSLILAMFTSRDYAQASKLLKNVIHIADIKLKINVVIKLQLLEQVNGVERALSTLGIVIKEDEIVIISQIVDAVKEIDTALVHLAIYLENDLLQSINKFLLVVVRTNFVDKLHQWLDNIKNSWNHCVSC